MRVEVAPASRHRAGAEADAEAVPVSRAVVPVRGQADSHHHRRPRQLRELAAGAGLVPADEVAVSRSPSE